MDTRDVLAPFLIQALVAPPSAPNNNYRRYIISGETDTDQHPVEARCAVGGATGTVLDLTECSNVIT